MATKIKIKATGSDAKEILSGPDPLGSGDVRVNPTKSSGDELMKENPASRQAEGKNKSESSDITSVVRKTMVVPTPEADPVQGYDTVKPVDRTRKADTPEAARRANNQARDMRTNLGRGKASHVEV
jgi:hypothetical protein